jgi:hypothetical protein
MSGVAAGPSSTEAARPVAPGKRALTDDVTPVQRRAVSSPRPEPGDAGEGADLEPAIEPFGLHLDPIVQCKEESVDRGATGDASAADTDAIEEEHAEPSTLETGERHGRARLSGARVARARRENRRLFAKLGFNADAFSDEPIDSEAFALAVAAFQASAGLEVDGIASPETCKRKRCLPESAAVQAKSASEPKNGDDQTHAIAAAGVNGGGGPLPYVDELHASFGRHADALDGATAHQGSDAAEAAGAIGAQAYTTGAKVAFAATPTRELVGHEAAHIVQQRGGVSLKGGVGAAGDPYERHADEVGDAFARGDSAEPILDRMPAGGTGSAALQRSSADVAAAHAAHDDNAGYLAAKYNQAAVARIYLHAVKGLLLPTLAEFVGQYRFDLGPGIHWAHAPRVIGAQFVHALTNANPDLADGLQECLRGVDLWALIDQHRTITGTYEGNGKPEPMGPTIWNPSVALAIAAHLQSPLMESFARMGGRYRDARLERQAQAIAAYGPDGQSAMPTVDDLVPGARIDRVTARVLAEPGFAIVDAPVTSKLVSQAHVPSPTETTPPVRKLQRRAHKYTWQGAVDPKLWNWIRVTDPADATVEEVAATLLDNGDPEGAYAEAERIVSAPPLFGIPAEVARRYPAAAMFERGVIKVPGGTYAPTVDPAIALGASAGAEDVALAQAQRTTAARVDAARAGDAKPAAAEHAHAGAPSSHGAPAQPDAASTRQHVLDAIAAIETQLQFLMGALSPFGHGGDVVPGYVRAAKERSRLEAAGDDEIARWAPVFAEQKALLYEISGDVGRLVDGAKRLGVRAAGDPGAKPYLDVLAAYGRAAATSHLVETSRGLVHEADLRARTLVADVVEHMVGDTGTEAETTQVTIGNVNPDLARLEHGYNDAGGDQQLYAMGHGKLLSLRLRTANQDIQRRIAELRARAARGETVDPGEVESILQAADVIRLASSMWNDLSTLWSLRALADDETSGKWNWVLNHVTLSAGDLGHIKDKATFLIGWLESLQRDLHNDQEMLGSTVAMYASEATRPDKSQISSHVREQVEKFRGKYQAIEQKLHDLGKDESIRDFLSWAYDKIHDAEIRKAIAQLAITIGVTIATDGLGEVAGGVAEGLNASDRAVAITHMVTSTAALSGFSAATSKGENAGARFAFDMITNLATSGALKAWGEASGRLTEDAAVMWERAGSVWKVARGTFRFTSDAVITLAVQFSVGQFEQAVRYGQQPTSGDAEEWLMQGAAIAVGHGVSAAVRPMKERFLHLPERGAALGRRATEVLGFAEQAETNRDRGAAQRALVEMAELARDEQAYLSSIANDYNTVRKLGLDQTALDRLVAHANQDVATAHSPEMTELMLRVGLDEAVPGRVYLGDRANIELSAKELSARGATVERTGDPGHEEIHAKLGEKEYVLRERGDTAPPQPHPATSAAMSDATQVRGSILATELANEATVVTSTLPPLQQTIDGVTAVDKGPEYEQAMADLRTFYGEMEAEARQVKTTSGRIADGPYRWGYANDAQAFSHGLNHVVFKVHLEPAPGVTAADLASLKTRVQKGVDHYYNIGKEVSGSDGSKHRVFNGVRGPDGVERRLHLEVEFVDTLADAHLNVHVLPGNGGARANRWFVNGHPTTDAHEVGHGAFGLRDEYYDPWGLPPGRDAPGGPGVRTDDSLMGDYWADPSQSVVKPNTELKGRHLDQIGSQMPTPSAHATPTTSTAPVATAASTAPPAAGDAMIQVRAAAASQLAAVPVRVMPAPDGSTAYVVSEVDAARIRALAPMLGPDVQVRDLPNGLLVRALGGERLFRVEDVPGTAHSPNVAHANALAREPDGLPQANVATLEFYGFRGVRLVNGKRLAELSREQRAEVEAILETFPLLKYGHVGVSFDGGKTIYGFTPDRDSHSDLTDEQFMALIRSNAPVPGLVKDDTEIFRLAERYQQQLGWNTEIVSSVQVVDGQRKAALQAQVNGMTEKDGRGAGAGHGREYQFPYEQPRGGSNYASPNCRNCATFMDFLGLPIPEPTGLLAAYIPALKEWATRSPIDQRSAKEKK